ncbi:hypothetical protein EOD42_08895 [Rhodovarius crocodyli]|uniref:Uncharacterized protein n=1 Tax=Rhodovarius crocodyli TaxID=1979269 RepID=A0A437MJP9_9PROT|nr:hypothetical protein [Rhodovarius crocodyli]RVT97897.1 hypothetical protein EOD42_08895 [Rhodovarius crocodyli]
MNPRLTIPDDWHELVRLWCRCRGDMGGLAHLPDPGGINDQSAWLIDAFGQIGGAWATQEDQERPSR